jgi:acyl-CoA hydrolase
MTSATSSAKPSATPSHAGHADLADTTRVTDVVFPEQANHYGTLFGGNALLMMGKVAFLAATRKTRSHVVMASVDGVVFKEPVRVGDLVECVARIEHIGRTSMMVGVEIIREQALTGVRSPAVRGSFKMVTVDAAGRPVPITPVSAKIEEGIPS